MGSFAGLSIDPASYLSVGFEEHHKEMVVLRDIPFNATCEHHLLPFVGKAHVGYIPSGRIVGLSKLARVVEAYAKRPQLQERLTSQIADTLIESINPRGVGVVIEAQHFCMIVRGVKKPGSTMVTSAMRGIFRTNPPPAPSSFSSSGARDRGPGIRDQGSEVKGQHAL